MRSRRPVRVQSDKIRVLIGGHDGTRKQREEGERKRREDEN